ncbi:MAG: DUF2784 domain-containing protein [Verrucomicrobia subdivision 3 bacterium]|nr:DUF2784 domain-containing protein [Limisphaerales bacterium]
MGATGYRLLADGVLILHFSFVLFVIVGFFVIWIGYFRRWNFVRNPWFRLAHLLAMAVVVAESVCGMVCPLTTWEQDLRARAGRETYAGSFIQHWVHRVMFFEIPEWVFTMIYVGFFVLILLTLVAVRPRAFRRSQ